MNELAKFRYRSGGEYPAPMVIRTPCGGGIKGGHYHSQSPEALFIHTPGSRWSARRTRTTPRACCSRAIRDDDPVMFFEPKRVYRAAKGEVPEGDYTVPLGKAKVRARGRAASRCIAWGAMVHTALEAAEQARGSRASTARSSTCARCCRSTSTTILASVKKTGRVVIVHEAPRTCGFGAELAALIAEKAHAAPARRPSLRVTGFDTPFPYTLENEYLPDRRTASWTRVERALNF